MLIICIHFILLIKSRSLLPSGEFTCSQPILAEVVSIDVGQYPDPMVIIYSLDLMVLLYALLYPSTQLDLMVENATKVDQ